MIVSSRDFVVASTIKPIEGGGTIIV